MSLVKDSKVLKKHIHDRLKELYPSNVGFGFKNSAVVLDASERRFKIAPEQLSRYFSDKPQKNTLSEAQIIWLAVRYGINIQLLVTSPKFDEAEAIKKLKLIFG